VIRSARQREDLTAELVAWHARAVTADRRLAMIYRYRVLIAFAAGFGAVVGLRGRRPLLPWLKRAWMAWGLLRTLRATRG
jgi:hypothetical protein